MCLCVCECVGQNEEKASQIIEESESGDNVFGTEREREKKKARKKLGRQMQQLKKGRREIVFEKGDVKFLRMKKSKVNGLFDQHAHTHTTTATNAKDKQPNSAQANKRLQCHQTL